MTSLQLCTNNLEKRSNIPALHNMIIYLIYYHIAMHWMILTLCQILLCRIVSYHTLLYDALLCRNISYLVALLYTILGCTLLSIIFYLTVLYCIILYSIISYRTVFYHYFISSCIVLCLKPCCIVPHSRVILQAAYPTGLYDTLLYRTKTHGIVLYGHGPYCII